MLSTQSTQATSGWHILNAPTFHLLYDETNIAINDSEFVVKDTRRWQRLEKFNIVHNAWTSIPISLPNNVGPWAPIVFDNKEKMLYIYAERKLVTFNLSTGYTRIYDSLMAVSGESRRTLLIGDKLHVVNCKKHFIFDKRGGSNLIQDYHQFLPDKLKCDLIIHAESRKSIIAMDGTLDFEPTFAEYSLATQRWEMLQWPGAPKIKLKCTGMVCSADGRFLITFGGSVPCVQFGYCLPFERTDLIFVYDLNDRTSAPKRSTVRCPVKGCFRVLKMTDKKKEEMTTFGYIRDCFGKEEFNGVQFPPRYIIEMIANWVEMEYMYLKEKCKNGGLWKRSMRDILKSHI